MSQAGGERRQPFRASSWRRRRDGQESGSAAGGELENFGTGEKIRHGQKDSQQKLTASYGKQKEARPMKGEGPSKYTRSYVLN